jgi:hypothetical protein
MCSSLPYYLLHEDVSFFTCSGIPTAINIVSNLDEQQSSLSHIVIATAGKIDISVLEMMTLFSNLRTRQISILKFAIDVAQTSRPCGE